MLALVIYNYDFVSAFDDNIWIPHLRKFPRIKCKLRKRMIIPDEIITYYLCKLFSIYNIIVDDCAYIYCHQMEHITVYLSNRKTLIA